MLAHALFTIALASGPRYEPQPVVESGEYITRDGHRTRWASVAYQLPDGKAAEVVMIASDAVQADGYLYVEGDALVHASWDASGSNSWTSTAPGANELAAAALRGLAAEPGVELLAAFAPDSETFKCSEWGKKVLNASRYIWAGVVAATGAACCLTAACIPCAAGMGAARLIGDDALKNYCD